MGLDEKVKSNTNVCSKVKTFVNGKRIKETNLYQSEKHWLGSGISKIMYFGHLRDKKKNYHGLSSYGFILLHSNTIVRSKN